MSTDQRIADVQKWFAEVRSYGESGNVPAVVASALLEKLDSHARAEPSTDEVERVAEAIYEAKWPGRVYAALSDEKKDDFRRLARAAIAALPPSGALGLAREIAALLASGLIYDGLHDQAKAALKKARALVAMLGGEKVTHAEALVYAAAFVEHITMRRDQGQTREVAAEEAVVKAWATVEALRHVTGTERTCSVEMLTEFRSFNPVMP